MGSNGTFVVGSNSTVNANNGSTVYVNDGAQLVDNRTNNTFSLLGARTPALAAYAFVESINRSHPESTTLHWGWLLLRPLPASIGRGP